MIALIQRVTAAKVEVEGEITGQIGKGLLVLLGVEKEDNHAKAEKLSEKVLNYRVFSDEDGKMNLNVQQAGGAILVVSQFTLVGRHSKRAAAKFFQGRIACFGRGNVRLFCGKVRSKNFDFYRTFRRRYASQSD